MKINLPNKKGFTLIELLVVIAIIAILAVIGFAAFRNVGAGRNDARRQADLGAISDALEVNKNQTTGFYSTLAPSQFGSGQIPVDPSGVRNYVISYTVCTDGLTAGTPFTAPAAWTTAAAPSGSAFAGVTPAGCTNAAWTTVNSSVPTGNVLGWKVCANLDTAVNGSTVVCRNSAQ
jgi:prepilin-type N-terminal cleavage/methylation domain-containing protein